MQLPSGFVAKGNAGCVAARLQQAPHIVQGNGIAGFIRVPYGFHTGSVRVGGDFDVRSLKALIDYQVVIECRPIIAC